MTRTRRIVAAATALAVGVAVLVTFATAQELGGPVDVSIAAGETIVIEGAPLIPDGGQSTDPQTCTEPSPSCDHYRVTMDLAEDPEALNFLVATLEWETVNTPPLALVAVGLNSLSVPDLDMYYYPADFDFDDPNAEPDSAGATASQPERIGYTVRDDVNVVDIIVNGYLAAGTPYTLTLYFSDELFDDPLEIRPPEARPGANTATPVSSPVAIDPPPVTGGPLRLDPETDGGDTASEPVPFPIEVDPDFAGTGLAVSDDLGGPPLDLSGAEQAVVADASPPSALTAVLWLLLAPLALAVAGGVLLYRRRPAALHTR